MMDKPVNNKIKLKSIERGEKVLPLIEEIKAEGNLTQELVSFLKGLPPMIRQNGLGQTIAFIMCKAKEEYLFSWNVPKSYNSERFMKFLKDDLKIELTENTEIKESEGGKAISIISGSEKITFKLEKEKNKVILETSSGKTYNFLLKEENGELKVYKEDPYSKILNIYNKVLLPDGCKYSLINKILNSEVKDYLYMQNEAIEYAGWMKKFAVAFFEPNKNDNKENEHTPA